MSKVLFLALVCCVLTRSFAANDFVHNHDLCVEISIERTICKLLRDEEAMKRGASVGEYSRLYLDSCSKAEELERERLAFLKRNNIINAEECDYFTYCLGEAEGQKVAKQLIEQINSGSQITKEVPSSFYSDILYNDALCFKYNNKVTICKQLKEKAAQGGEKASEFVRASRKPCEKARELNEDRLAFLKRKGITGQVGCSQKGARKGLDEAKTIIERIVGGSNLISA